MGMSNELYVKSQNTICECLIGISRFLKCSKLNILLTTSAVKITGVVLIFVSMFYLGGYANSCKLIRGGEKRKMDSLIQPGYLDIYVEELVLNSSNALEVKSCRSPAKLDDKRWEIIKVNMRYR